jgi:hypothetical protein
VARFTYLVTLDDGTEHRFIIDLNRKKSAPKTRGALPVWTALDEHKCPNCPLPSVDDAVCPAARDLVPLVEEFKKTQSIAKVEVRVINDEREVKKNTDAQTALGSLMGLLMASSGCPILDRLQPLAAMHQPFPTATETIYRTVALHLVRAFVEGREPNLDELRKFYEDVDQVNFAFAERLRAAVERDASLNALVLLQSSGALVSFSIENDLARLRKWLAELT